MEVRILSLFEALIHLSDVWFGVEETLALKGLTYNFLDKKEEAYKYCRLGIRYNIMSPICTWISPTCYCKSSLIKEPSFRLAHVWSCVSLGW